MKWARHNKKNRERRRRPQCAKTGLTLVETLVAVIILSIALIVYLDVLVAANRATRKGDYLARASQVAAGRIALVQAQGFAALVPGRRVYRVDTLPQGRMTLTVRAMGSGAAGSHIKQVDLRITWRGPSSAPQTSGQVESSTLVSELK